MDGLDHKVGWGKDRPPYEAKKENEGHRFSAALGTLAGWGVLSPI